MDHGCHLILDDFLNGGTNSELSSWFFVVLLNYSGGIRRGGIIKDIRICNIKAFPGANRLLKHLSGHGVPMALASNSPTASIESKISHHQGWKESFCAIIGGDEVTTGKPSPEIFLEAAKKLNMEPSSCLVIEDSVLGVLAGKAAQMEVVAVPSVPKQTQLFSAADEIINSLLDLRPQKWGLPAFEDWIEGTLPIQPCHIGGPVIKGFGRTSKVLGIPTGTWYKLCSWLLSDAGMDSFLAGILSINFH